MSQADIETLRAGYEAVGRRDWDSMFKGAVLRKMRFRPRGSSAVVENRIGPSGRFVTAWPSVSIFPEREKVLEAICMSEEEAQAEAV